MALLLVMDKDDLKILLSAVTGHRNQMGLRLNINKTKGIVISKNQNLVKNLSDIRIVEEIVDPKVS